MVSKSEFDAKEVSKLGQTKSNKFLYCIIINMQIFTVHLKKGDYYWQCF